MKTSDYWHTLEWYRRRRGKTIYRKPIKKEDGSICCTMCEKTSVYVSPQTRPNNHAEYLWSVQNDLNIRYHDSPV